MYRGYFHSILSHQIFHKLYYCISILWIENFLEEIKKVKAKGPFHELDCSFTPTIPTTTCVCLSWISKTVSSTFKRSWVLAFPGSFLWTVNITCAPSWPFCPASIYRTLWPWQHSKELKNFVKELTGLYQILTVRLCMDYSNHYIYCHHRFHHYFHHILSYILSHLLCQYQEPHHSNSKI